MNIWIDALWAAIAILLMLIGDTSLTWFGVFLYALGNLIERISKQ